MKDRFNWSGSSGTSLPPQEPERDALILMDTLYEDIRCIKEDTNLLEEVILQLESDRRKRFIATDPTN